MEDNGSPFAPILIMCTHDGHFYPIEAMKEIPLDQQAKDHGELNNTSPA